MFELHKGEDWARCSSGRCLQQSESGIPFSTPRSTTTAQQSSQVDRLITSRIQSLSHSSTHAIQHPPEISDHLPISVPLQFVDLCDDQLNSCILLEPSSCGSPSSPSRSTLSLLGSPAHCSTGSIHLALSQSSANPGRARRESCINLRSTHDF